MKKIFQIIPVVFFCLTTYGQSKIADTIIKFEINKVILEYKVPKKLVNELRNFEKVIRIFSNGLTFKSITHQDITGNGFQDDFITTISIIDNDAIVTNIITENTKIIWYDTLRVGNSAWYYWSDSVFFKLKPYSTFYLAYKYQTDCLIKSPNYYYQKMPLQIKCVEGYNENKSYWDKLSKNFKGRLIAKLSIEDRDIYIWDGNKHKFILYYSP